MIGVTTTGNATLIAYDTKPILSTDPWFGDEDPAYFGSWILSHKIPNNLKKDILESKYLWFSHGHPDHLNPESIKRFKGKKILLPDHYNGRIFKDLTMQSYDVEILPDRKWVNLSRNIKVLCITTIIQDSILLLDVNGVLFVNTNDAGTRNCTNFIKNIAKKYEKSFILSLAGYGDADMINFYDDKGNFIEPHANNKFKVGTFYNGLLSSLGVKGVIPFSAFHKYQREDSIWAQKYTTPIKDHALGLNPAYQFIEPFVTIDCTSHEYQNYLTSEINPEIKKPEQFGDNWSDELEKDDKKMIKNYFMKKRILFNKIGFLRFVVGNKEYVIDFNKDKQKGISFEAPRNSLITATKFEIFDDLLIGNFMKTRLHNIESLYSNDVNFNFLVAKYSDNGRVFSEEDLINYKREYRRRAGREYIYDLFADQAKNFVSRLLIKNKTIYKIVRSTYYNFIK